MKAQIVLTLESSAPWDMDLGDIFLAAGEKMKAMGTTMLLSAWSEDSPGRVDPPKPAAELAPVPWGSSIAVADPRADIVIAIRELTASLTSSQDRGVQDVRIIGAIDIASMPVPAAIETTVMSRDGEGRPVKVLHKPKK